MVLEGGRQLLRRNRRRLKISGPWGWYLIKNKQLLWTSSRTTLFPQPPSTFTNKIFGLGPIPPYRLKQVLEDTSTSYKSRAVHSFTEHVFDAWHR